MLHINIMPVCKIDQIKSRKGKFPCFPHHFHSTMKYRTQCRKVESSRIF